MINRAPKKFRPNKSKISAPVASQIDIFVTYEKSTEALVIVESQTRRCTSATNTKWRDSIYLEQQGNSILRTWLEDDCVDADDEKD